MFRQGWDLQLTEYGEATGARRSTTGQADSIVGGSAWEPTPWRAVQRAAWAALFGDGCSSAAEPLPRKQQK